MDKGRLSDVGSSMSCVRWVWLLVSRILLLGKFLEMVLRSSGVNLVLVSVVALHLVSRCTMFSSGGEYCGERALQRRQWGLWFLSLPRYEKQG